jgi:DNA-binding NarL/FixJ family response regulator
MLIVLAIENFDLRLSIELLLNEEPGVEIVGSASESEGLLALVKSSQPDMVVLSWDLPGSSGQELLEIIDAQEFRPAIIVIGDSLHEKPQALNSGANAFITKGDSPDLLAAAFRRLRKEKGFLSK